MPFILCFTVLASVGIGVFAAYVAVFGMLMLFTFGCPAQSEPARGRLVLVSTQIQASGDQAADAETASFGCLQVPPGSANTSPLEVDFGA